MQGVRYKTNIKYIQYINTCHKQYTYTYPYTLP